jgi:hypothetical protein
MGSAKPISLRVRPFQAAHLCFEVGGILDFLRPDSSQPAVELGFKASFFDFRQFHNTLSAFPTHAGDPSRLRFDSAEIETAVKHHRLAALRAEGRKAALNKAINMRQNSYFSKYGNASKIVSRVMEYYSDSPAFPTSKPNRLANLATLADSQNDQLQAAYADDDPPRTGVVKNTESILCSETKSHGGSDAVGRSDVLRVADHDVKPQIFPAPPDGGTWTSLDATKLHLDKSAELEASGDHETSWGNAHQRQKIENTDFAYRVPSIESQAQNERAQISLMDQQFAQFMFTQTIPHLPVVFANELNSIDNDVFQLQIALLNTFLMSPISGIVTGVYKYPGDAVKAGEPVFRIEDNTFILIEAILIYRGPIAIDSVVTVNTALFDSASVPTTIAGKVVAVRGLSVDDKWEVIVKCNNIDSTGNVIFPLGYHFDFDDTTISIT